MIIIGSEEWDHCTSSETVMIALYHVVSTASILYQIITFLRSHVHPNMLENVSELIATFC